MKGSTQRNSPSSNRMSFSIIFLSAMLWVIGSQSLQAKEDSVEIATQLTNPIAYITSFPFQYNYDQGLGPKGNGRFQYLEIQPFIPAHLNNNWHLISHFIMPMAWEHNVIPNTNLHGLGDLQYEAFFAPSHPFFPGTFWGLGPFLSFPTETEGRLGNQQYLTGVSGVVLQQRQSWTYGVLAHQAWATARKHELSPVNNATNLYVQPFISYVTSSAWTYTLNIQSTYVWSLPTKTKWAVPINAMVSKLIPLNEWALSVQGGIRYWAANPVFQAREFGLRFGISLVFPERTPPTPLTKSIG